MMRYTLVIFFLHLLILSQAQFTQAPDSFCEQSEFNQLVHSNLNYTVPVISVKHLQNNFNDYLILDAREKEEYAVSHLPGAIHVGYKNPDYTVLKNVASHRAILVYCSIGYRSEKISEVILKRGYKNVYNLYGSIFEWVNQGLDLENSEGQPSKQIHGYNKKWSKWIFNKKIEVVY